MIFTDLPNVAIVDSWGNQAHHTRDRMQDVCEYMQGDTVLCVYRHELDGRASGTAMDVRWKLADVLRELALVKLAPVAARVAGVASFDKFYTIRRTT